jgi:hypothetical protein
MGDLSGIELLRLYGTCHSTRMGTVDRGLGQKYETQLESGGYIKKQNTTDFTTGKTVVGYVATELGFATMKKEMYRLFPPKKKEKKQRRSRDNSWDDDDE